MNSGLISTENIFKCFIFYVCLDIERIKDRKKIYHDANGKLKINEYLYIQFKTLNKILKENE